MKLRSFGAQVIYGLIVGLVLGLVARNLGEAAGLRLVLMRLVRPT